MNFGICIRYLEQTNLAKYPGKLVSSEENIQPFNCFSILVQVFPNENRAQLINDAFSLARVGRVDYPIALNLTLYMDKENDYIPWEAALGVISYITDMFSRYSGYGPLEVIKMKKNPQYSFL